MKVSSANFEQNLQKYQICSLDSLLTHKKINYGRDLIVRAVFLSELIGTYAGIPKEAKYLIYATILPSVAYGMLFTDLSYFLTTVQGMTADFVGVVLFSTGVAVFISSLLLGIAADVYGRRKMLIGGNILSSVILVVFALTTNPILLLTAALLWGISEAAVLASSTALLAEKVGHDKRNCVFSLYSFAQSMAFGLGSLSIPLVLVFEIAGFTNNESHIILYVLLAALSLSSTLLILKASESGKLKKPALSFSDLLPKKSKDVLAKYVFSTTLIAFGAGLVVPLMTLWFHYQYNISDAISAPILAVSSMLIGLATLLGPFAAKRFGLIKAIVFVQLLSTVFMFLTPLSPNFALAGLVYSIRALLMNMASPLSQSMIMGLTAEDERGTASGISGALWRLPNALSTWIGAWLMGIGFLAEPFFIASLFYIVSILLFWVFFRKVKMPEELCSPETVFSE